MSIFDHPDTVPTAPSWRCPHCATLQAETTRCWACLRSPVACGSCRFFREAIAAELTYCGLDAAHKPVGRDEVRTCWRPNSNRIDDDSGLFSTAQLEAESAEVATAVKQAPVVAAPARTLSQSRITTQSGTVTPARSDAAAPTVSHDGLVDAPHVAPARGLPGDAGWHPRSRHPIGLDDLDLD